MTTLSALQQELSGSLGPAWDMVSPAPQSHLYWADQSWREVPVLVIGGHGDWSNYKLSIVFQRSIDSDECGFIYWNLRDGSRNEHLYSTKWKDLREAVFLSTDYIQRQKRIAHSLQEQ